MNIVQKLMKIVFGYANGEEKRPVDDKVKLAHYTSAETALQILRGRALWMRNATVMNDHSEIQHGHKVVGDAIKGEPGKRLQAALTDILPALGNAGWPRMLPLTETARSQIFMTSLSEHSAGDNLGRLSMWRAYGGPIAGVALIFHPDIIGDPQITLRTVASPVLYGGAAEFEVELDKLIARLKDAAETVRSVGADIAGPILAAALRYAYISIKHLGLKEELEWRLIHQPFRDGGNAWVRDKVVAVRGIPQLVYELPLAEIHDGMSVPGLNLNRLLHKVIIGPSLYPATIQRAFIDQLSAVGVENAASKVVISDIPLRQWG